METRAEWKRRGILVGWALLLGSVTALAAPGGKIAKTRSKAVDKAPKVANAGTVGLHVTVYETTLPADRIAEMDTGALQARAETTTGLKGALAKLGETKILYHVYQLAGVPGESRIHLGRRRPVVTNSRMLEAGPRTRSMPRLSGSASPPSGSRAPRSERGADRPAPRVALSARGPSRINTVQYEDTGMMLELSVKPVGREPKGVFHAEMSLELSVLADGGVEIAPGVKAVETRQIRTNQSGEMRLARPVLTVHVDAASGGKAAGATAYVCRVLLSEVP